MAFVTVLNEITVRYSQARIVIGSFWELNISSLLLIRYTKPRENMGRLNSEEPFFLWRFCHNPPQRPHMDSQIWNFMENLMIWRQHNVAHVCGSLFKSKNFYSFLWIGQKLDIQARKKHRKILGFQPMGNCWGINFSFFFQF